VDEWRDQNEQKAKNQFDGHVRTPRARGGITAGLFRTFWIPTRGAFGVKTVRLRKADMPKTRSRLLKRKPNDFFWARGEGQPLFLPFR